MILNSESHQLNDADVLYDKVKVVADHFKSMLMANGCSTEHLKERPEILHNHIKRYVSKNTTDKCWQIIFNISYDVGIRSLFHAIERSLTTSFSNKESKPVFSCSWCLFSKERQSNHFYMCILTITSAQKDKLKL